jgi:tetratricopeptide (TPR) repeat protein
VRGALAVLVVVRVGLVALPALTACIGQARPTAPDFGPVADAPYQLEDDLDRAELRDRLWSLPPGKQRSALRRELAAAQVSRALGHVARGRWHLVHETLLDLAGLYQGDAAALGAELAPHREALRRIADTLRRSGADAEIVTALVLAHAAGPGDPAADRAELDEVLSFLDDLGMAEHGEVGRHARTLPALEPIVKRAAPSWLVDLYVERVVARQRLVSDRLNRDGASFALVAAHRDVLGAARTVAGALARDGRAPAIAAAVQPIDGIGEDESIAVRAAAVAAGGDARDWVQLARVLRGDGKDAAADDPEAALAVTVAALVRFPDDATLLAAAADHAAALDRLQQPIALLERARRVAPADGELAQRLADLYRERLAQLAFGGRPLAARRQLASLEAFHRELARGAAAGTGDESLARALATVGRGLVSQGLLDEAIGLLERSARLAPSVEAYEMLGTIALKRERWDEAQAHLAAGLRLPATTPAARYARAKLLRLAGDAAGGAGDTGTARKLWIATLATWADLGDELDLPPNLAGERLIESGRALWALGDAARSVELFETAVDVDPGGGDTHVQVVAFLILHDRFGDALDAYHRGLGADRVGDYHKVYMSLWVLAEARRRGAGPDPLALDYLRGRDGGLWYDRLAQLATGRAAVGSLRAQATTRAQRAELAYYTAVLGIGDGGTPPAADQLRALFDAVIATDMVLFFEYDMARHWRRAWLPARA